VKKQSPYLLALYGSLIAVLLFFRYEYNTITSWVHLPERFEHTFYKVALAILTLECLRHILLLTYNPENPRFKRDNFTIGVAHLARVAYSLLLVVLALALFNISLKEAFTTLSLIAAAVVLVTKDYIGNLITGMYITFTRLVNVGDQVAIDGHKGKIVDITLSTIHLLNDDDDLLFIPNNKVFASEIINYTRRDLKKTSIDFEVDNLAVRDIGRLEQVLIETLRPFENDIQPGTYALKTVAVRKDSLQFKFQFVLKEPLNKEKDKQIRRFFVRELVKILASPDRGF
jgi:small-conductance mechanosensitive channel